jgi:hypothetical protein
MSVFTEKTLRSAECSTASFAFSREKVWVTICLSEGILPEATRRMAFGQVSRCEVRVRGYQLPVDICFRFADSYEQLTYRNRNLRSISFVDRCMKGMVKCDLPTPRTKTRPEGLQAYEATAIELSTPVHSRTLEGIVSPPTPCVAAVKTLTIWRADSSGVRFRSILKGCTSGQSFLAKSRRSCARSVMTMGEAPAAAAHSSWQTPMGPAPVTNDG